LFEKKKKNERQKTKLVPIPLSRAAGSCFAAKKMKKRISLTWTSEIIQFIRFEMHMDRPDKSKKNLGYDINYLSISIVLNNWS
jgi:hypothetical protein